MPKIKDTTRACTSRQCKGRSSRQTRDDEYGAWKCTNCGEILRPRKRK